MGNQRGNTVSIASKSECLLQLQMDYSTLLCYDLLMSVNYWGFFLLWRCQEMDRKCNFTHHQYTTLHYKILKVEICIIVAQTCHDYIFSKGTSWLIADCTGSLLSNKTPGNQSVFLFSQFFSLIYLHSFESECCFKLLLLMTEEFLQATRMPLLRSNCSKCLLQLGRCTCVFPNQFCS